MKPAATGIPAGSFRHSVSIDKGDIDHMGHVNNVVYVRWVQEVASSHWKTIAGEDLRRRYAWVLLRHEIDYVEPVFPGDQVDGFTWVGTHNGARFERFVTLAERGSGKIVAVSRTMWCLLDAATKRPRRIDQHLITVLESPGDDVRPSSV